MSHRHPPGRAMPGPAWPQPATAASRERRDRGAASVWVLAIGLVFVVAGLAGAAVGAARVAKHQARTAADLGALAGAALAIEGEEAACGRAADLVAHNGGRLTRCVIDGLDVIVAVEVEVTPLPGITRTARQEARAGPVRARTR
ncbi:flp pilus-assembly TadE/G-like family protein [Micromonospora sp. CPCC 205371]|nr:flp pilus-assembly TadE/G-like family protein [Micromonospora sp. CPCC 205371]